MMEYPDVLSLPFMSSVPSPSSSSLPEALFLIDVEDPVTGVVTRTLNELRSPVLLLSIAATHFAEAASRYFKNHLDLGSVDWRILFLLARAPGATAAQATRAIGVDKGAVSRSLQRLEERGLLLAGDLHANGRSRGWHLSPQGISVHAQILQVALERQNELLEGFTHEEIGMFCGLLGRFLQSVDAMTLRTQGESET